MKFSIKHTAFLIFLSFLFLPPSQAFVSSQVKGSSKASLDQRLSNLETKVSDIHQKLQQLQSSLDEIKKELAKKSPAA